MVHVFEATPECAAAVKEFCDNVEYKPKHPKLKSVIVHVGAYSVAYVIDGVLTNLVPVPVKFPVIVAKIAQKIGIAVLSGMVAEKAARYLEHQYDKNEIIVYDTVDKIKDVMKEDKDVEAVTECI